MPSVHRSSLGDTLFAAIALAASLGLAVPGHGSTFVMPTDDELLGRTPVVIMGEVVATEPAPEYDVPSTDYWVEVERPLKGFIPASTVLVRVAGGVRDDGLAMRVIGAPAFRVGEKVVLFLEGHESGAYRIVDLALGAFHQVTVGGRSYALRDLLSSTELLLPNDPQASGRALSRLPRQFDRFVDWLAERANGSIATPDYFVDENRLVSVASGWQTTKSPTAAPPLGCGPKGGNHVRWTQIDRHEPVLFTAHESGQAGVPGGGFAEVQAAAAVWNALSDTAINLAYGGTTNRTSGGTGVDGFNTFIFEDPGNSIAGSFRGSGTVAVATVFFDCDVIHTFPVGIAHDLVEFDIVTQDGSGGFFFSLAGQPGVPFSEVAAHELGHALGLAHSSEGNALMAPFVHNDGRGARLEPDDRAGARYLYGAPTIAGTPSAPSGLAVTAVDTGSLNLTWTDNATNEDSFDIELRSVSGQFQHGLTVGANITSATVGGLPEASAWIFRVRSRNSIGSSSFSQEALGTTFGTIGTCVQDATTVCLANDRFRVNIRFLTAQGADGVGTGSELTGNTAVFWFFQPTNIELVVKVLDGCSFNSAYWVFAGGLTNVLVEMTVLDTRTGRAKTYVNPQLTEFDPIQDTVAFFTCP